MIMLARLVTAKGDQRLQKPSWLPRVLQSTRQRGCNSRRRGCNSGRLRQLLHALVVTVPLKLQQLVQATRPASSTRLRLRGVETGEGGLPLGNEARRLAVLPVHNVEALLGQKPGSPDLDVEVMLRRATADLVEHDGHDTLLDCNSPAAEPRLAAPEASAAASATASAPAQRLEARLLRTI